MEILDKTAAQQRSPTMIMVRAPYYARLANPVIFATIYSAIVCEGNNCIK
jgi:hypothetical protein